MKKVVLKILSSLVVISIIPLVFVDCEQSPKTTLTSKMTAIEVCQYADKTLANRYNYYYISDTVRLEGYYNALSAKQLEKDTTIKSTYLKAGEWVLQVQLIGELQRNEDGKWVGTKAPTTPTTPLIIQYKFDETTATLEEIK